MTAPKPTRIIVIEDNFYARLGTVTLLQSQDDLQVVGEAEEGLAGVRLYTSELPDVAIVDLRMPLFDGIAVAQAIVAAHPQARVVVLSQHDGEELVFRALKAGARGYVTKDTGGQDLLAAIREVMKGNRYLPPRIAARLADRMTQPELTNQERRVLEKICQGLSNKQIAADMKLSQKTVAMYVSIILKKLRVNNRTEAATVAVQRGLVS